MANAILHKWSSVAGKAPAAADLALREIAVNTADGRAYMKKGDGSIVLLNPDDVIYDGPVKRLAPTCVRFCEYATTDSNGRITFNTTKDGTTTGAAIFSTVFGITLAPMATGTGLTNMTNFCIESVNAKSVVVRGFRPLTLLALGNTAAFVGAGVGCYITVEGLP